VDDGKGGLTRGDMVSLFNFTETNSPSRLKIVRGLHPSHLGVQAGELFMQQT
jgi:hypothetical protein